MSLCSLEPLSNDVDSHSALPMICRASIRLTLSSVAGWGVVSSSMTGGGVEVLTRLFLRWCGVSSSTIGGGVEVLTRLFLRWCGVSRRCSRVDSLSTESSATSTENSTRRSPTLTTFTFQFTVEPPRTTTYHYVQCPHQTTDTLGGAFIVERSLARQGSVCVRNKCFSSTVSWLLFHSFAGHAFVGLFSLLTDNKSNCDNIKLVSESTRRLGL